MRNLLYFTAVILLVAWIIGFIGFNLGGFIHVLLVIAFVALIQGVIQGRKVI